MSGFVFPPRGTANRNRSDGALGASWGDPAWLPGSWTWQAGRACLGTWKGRLYGIDDDRHLVMVAGSRAGKTATMLLPNLKTYPGPCVVIDPKGELAAATAGERGRFGPVHVLDPFGITGQASASHNPFQELTRSKVENRAADAAQIADALIIEPQGAKDTHWTDSAKNLLTGLILFLLHTDPARATVRDLRELLNATPQELNDTFRIMATCDDYEDGAMANCGAAFLSMVEYNGDGEPVGFTGEMRSILSTARQQTGPLDQVAKVMDASSFSFADIGRQNLTIYLVLPASRIGTHYRWLRLFIMQALAAMEVNPIPRGRLPVWFILEEFASLGHVQAIESASGYMAGFGVKLWVILQDLTQLRRHYSQSWETFLGNAGVTLAFGNVDATTTKYLSDLLGQTTIIETQQQATTMAQREAGAMGRQTSLRTLPLMAPDEISLHFSRETQRVLVLVPGAQPIYLQRMGRSDS